MIVNHRVDAGEPNPRLLQKQQVLFTTAPAPEEEGGIHHHVILTAAWGTVLDHVIKIYWYPTLLGPTILVQCLLLSSLPLFSPFPLFPLKVGFMYPRLAFP